MSDQCTYRHFRKASDGGGSKDWAIAAMDGGGVRIRYCATDSTARLTEVPLDRCDVRSAQMELSKRVLAKIDEGYEEIGFARINARGRLEAAVLEDKQGRSLYWELPMNVFRDEFLGAMKSIVEKLEHCPEDTVILFDGMKITTTFYGSQWSIGYNGGGVLDNHRGGGSAGKSSGPVPVLILMALKKVLGMYITLSDGANVVDLRITRDNPFLQCDVMPFDQVRDIAAMLGLCMRNIELSKIDTGSKPIVL